MKNKYLVRKSKEVRKILGFVDSIKLCKLLYKDEEEKIYSIYKNSFERFKVQHLFYILKSKKLEKVWNRICRESEWKNININIPYINK